MQDATVLEVFDLDIGVQSELSIKLFAKVCGNMHFLVYFYVLIEIDCEFFIAS